MNDGETKLPPAAVLQLPWKNFPTEDQQAHAQIFLIRANSSRFAEALDKLKEKKNRLKFFDSCGYLNLTRAFSAPISFAIAF